MLSTISGFISAISYVTYYDLLPAIGIRGSKDENKSSLSLPRSVTFFVVLIIYVLYLWLKSQLAGGSLPQQQDEKVGQALYAIYAFQLAIAPSVMVALFASSAVRPLAIVASTVCGLFAAYWSATTQNPFESLIANDSWYVIPPIAVLMASGVSYAVCYFFQRKNSVSVSA